MRPAALALAFACAGCAGGRLDSAPAREHGQAFAARACAGCHAIAPGAASPNPPAPPFPALAERFDDQALRARLGEIARDGHGAMPPIYLTQSEIGEVAAYIASFRGPG